MRVLFVYSCTITCPLVNTWYMLIAAIVTVFINVARILLGMS